MSFYGTTLPILPLPTLVITVITQKIITKYCHALAKQGRVLEQ
jgi:hypothetical protein